MTTGGKRWRRYESSAIAPAYPVTSLSGQPVTLTKPVRQIGPRVLASNHKWVHLDSGQAAKERDGSGPKMDGFRAGLAVRQPELTLVQVHVRPFELLNFA